MLGDTASILRAELFNKPLIRLQNSTIEENTNVFLKPIKKIKASLKDLHLKDER